ncbi:MAG: FGGY family carbohydrate kinase [Bryobacteraceae bacterium]
MPLLLALDEGTTSARAALYNEQGERLSMQSRPIACAYPHPGWVEQDADEIWRAQVESARHVLSQAKGAVTALGITNQRETTVVWDRRTGKPVAPAIVWQCRRTADFCRELAESGAAITARTGLVIDAYFSGSKIKWILDNVTDARARAEDGELLFGNVDAWLIWRLTNGEVHVTDHSNASRTQLMDLREGDWNDDLLRTFDVPRAMLPRIVGSSEIVGVAQAEHLGVEVLIAGIAGDQQAALAGQACFKPGLTKNTYGTGCFALMHTGGQAPVSAHKLLATRAATINHVPQYAVEGSVFIGARRSMVARQDRIDLDRRRVEAVASSVPDTDGVYLVPAFVGLGAPYWDAKARGTLTGMTQGHGSSAYRTGSTGGDCVPD